MSSLFSKALVYLGLVDEDGVESEAADRPPSAPAEDQPRRVEPRRVEPMSESRRVEPPPTSRAANRPGLETVGVIRTVDTQSDIIVVEEFGDARILADRIRDRVPVVLDMRRADHDLVRRVVDFSSGLIYALDGSMRKVGDGLVMVLPPRVTLSRDEKRRLSSLGAYELDDVDD
jgi:cell division inhibitor SepF